MPHHLHSAHSGAACARLPCFFCSCWACRCTPSLARAEACPIREARVVRAARSSHPGTVEDVDQTPSRHRVGQFPGVSTASRYVLRLYSELLHSSLMHCGIAGELQVWRAFRGPGDLTEIY